MRNKIKIKRSILLLAIVFALTVINSFNIFDDLSKTERTIQSRDDSSLKSPRISGYWTTNFIHIDGNWSYTVGNYSWASGDGSWSNPYIIENVTIDASTSSTGSGIFINNSKNDYFIIRNCTVYNAGSEEYDAGIKLENSNNGTITNNNCSNNGKNGILLFGNCQNNIISENIASNMGTTNQDRGIHFAEGPWGWIPAGIIDISPSGDSSPLTWGTYGSGASHAARLVPRFHDNAGLLGTSNHIDTFFMEDIDIDETKERIGQLVVRFYGHDLWGDAQIGVNGSHESIITPQWQSFPGFMTWRYFTFSSLQLTEAELNNLEISIIAVGGGYNTFVEIMYVDCFIETIGSIGPQHNTISGNIASKNTQSGINLTNNCNNNTVSENFLFENGYGIYLANESDDNLLFYNSLSNNLIENAYDNGTNNWNNSLLGNYWEDYIGVDANNDGIGDTPYNVSGPGGSIDYKPLMNIKPYFLETPNDVSYEVGTSGNKLTWKVVDMSRFLLTYDIFMNGLLIESGLLLSQIADIEIFIDGLSPDNYIFTIEIYDGGGTSSFDSVWVTVINTESIFTTTPNDFSYTEGEVGNNLSWTFSDVSTYNPTYTISRNNVPIIIDNPCVSGQIIEISVDGLDVGSHGFTIEIDDGYGGSILDSVWVKVNSSSVSNLNTLLYVGIVDQSFSIEEFNITFSVYNSKSQGIDFAAIQLWWDGIDFSAGIQNSGEGLYFISVDPITVAPGGDPILLNMIISALGYQDKNFDTYLAVDPEILDKGIGELTGDFPLNLIIIASTSIAGGIGVVGIIVYLLRKRK